jgi:GAF domain-containing protein
MYRDLLSAAEGLTTGEPDPIANMANVAALIWETLPDLNWAASIGMWTASSCRSVPGTARVHPHSVRRGRCGAAAERLRVQRVEDVHAFPGHIACDAASASELVVPIVAMAKLSAVLDLDSPTPSRFTEEDEAACVALCELLGQGALAQLFQAFVAETSRDDHHGTGQLP